MTPGPHHVARIAAAVGACSLLWSAHRYVAHVGRGFGGAVVEVPLLPNVVWVVVCFVFAGLLVSRGWPAVPVGLLVGMWICTPLVVGPAVFAVYAQARMEEVGGTVLEVLSPERHAPIPTRVRLTDGAVEIVYETTSTAAPSTTGRGVVPKYRVPRPGQSLLVLRDPHGYAAARSSGGGPVDVSNGVVWSAALLLVATAWPWTQAMRRSRAASEAAPVA